ncbi:MAG: O-antigen ligase family protein [Ignavibacteriaceae bacterium]
MQISFDKNSSEGIYTGNKIIFGVCIALTFFLAIILRQFGFNHITLGLLIGLPVIGLFLFSFETFLILFIFSLFINYDALMFTVVTLLAVPLFISYLITSTGINVKSLKNALTFPFLIYLFTMLPSLINSINIPLSIYLMFNLFAMVLTFHILAERIETQEKIKKYLYVFITICAINGMDVFLQFFTNGGRVFGFTGIVFVDYSSMAILAALIFFIFSKSVNKYSYLLLSLFLLTALIFTQTRNTLISLGLSFLTLIVYLIKENKLFSLNRKRIISFFIITIIICVLFAVGIILYAPEIFKRFTNLTAYNQMFVVGKSSVGVNSTLVTRVLIWLTAYNAFIQHPIIGIGAFAFPFSSHLYYTIPTILFKIYVEGLSTHITFLSTLTETGIIGTIGFLIFLITSLRIGFKSVKLSFSENERILSVVILFLQIYIFFSMFMTDAWLWGQCGMLWGFILGLSLANYKILLQKASVSNVQ